MKSLICFFILSILAGCQLNGNPVDKGRTSVTSSDVVYDNSKIDSPAGWVIKITPKYPSIALDNKLEGKVELSFIVNEVGIPINIEITKSEQNGVFDENAINVLNKYRFKPGFHKGKAVLVKHKETIIFRLD